MALEIFYSALHWSKRAERFATSAANSAQTAQTAAAQASQASGKIVQLGFDGAIEDGKLVFKHAPSGVEVPYELLDDYEYEVDLSYTGADLPSLTEMYVKNGADTISFVSAEHRSSTDNARVADMDAVMRYNSDTGYRWLFKATFKITPSGDKVFLLYPVIAAKDYSDKTNCITEIPQDIKLELADGILTLKAGSKVYVPNGKNADGTNKFDVVVVEADITLPSISAISAQRMLFYNSANKMFGWNNVENCLSGTATEQVSGKMYYNTSLNRVVTNNNTASANYSLPICTFSAKTTANVTDSIDQVFNGFGYIGSTVFMLDGTKGLAPNGRNADGSLKNTEVVCKGVAVHSTASAGAFYVYIKPNAGCRFTSKAAYFEQNEQPTVPATYAAWYSPAENKFRWTNDGGVTWINPDGFVNCITITTTTGGVITSFTPKTAFHAVDRNDSSWVSGLGMPSDKYIDLTLGANDSIYTAPANGYFAVVKASSGTGQFITFINDTSGYSSNSASPASGNTLRLMFPCLKGNSVRVNYSLGGVTNSFRFYYAKGEN